MFKRHNPSNYAFWILILIIFAVVGVGLEIIEWQYRQGWLQTFWHLCHSGLKNLGQHRAAAWQLLVLGIMVTVTTRAGWSIIQQVRSTKRFARLFLPLREMPSPRLQTLLAAQRHSPEDFVYLNLSTTHVFCLGLWRPQIWLTVGLANLLTDEELTAVLAHELYHCRRRDPLRLLISRAIKSALFFLPLVDDLAKLAELQQEIAADQAAIEYLGDDLPLLCSLQKLLTQGTQPTSFPQVALTSFNVTEARLRRLVYPVQSPLFNWRRIIIHGFINVVVVIFLYGLVFLSMQPIIQHQDIGACPIEGTANLW